MYLHNNNTFQTLVNFTFIFTHLNCQVPSPFPKKSLSQSQLTRNRVWVGGKNWIFPFLNVFTFQYTQKKTSNVSFKEHTVQIITKFYYYISFESYRIHKILD